MTTRSRTAFAASIALAVLLITVGTVVGSQPPADGLSKDNERSLCIDRRQAAEEAVQDQEELDALRAAVAWWDGQHR